MSDQPSTSETIACRWDPVNPAACFDDDACGCYVDPCLFFGMAHEDCPNVHWDELCCTVVETCCELER